VSTIADYTAGALQLLLGVVFLAAAAPKLRNPSRFAQAIRGYRLIHSGLVGPVAGIVVVLEAFVGMSLVSARGLVISVPVAGALLVTFAIAVGLNLRRGNVVPCGCFGSASERISARTLTRLGLLIFAVAVLAVFQFGGGESQSLVTGADALQRLILTIAIAAWLAAMAGWVLHIPELTLLLRGIRG
jgi:putative oxidoreductase